MSSLLSKLNEGLKERMEVKVLFTDEMSFNLDV